MIKTAYVLFFSCMLLMSSCHSRRHDSSPKEENPEYVYLGERINDKIEGQYWIDDGRRTVFIRGGDVIPNARIAVEVAKPILYNAFGKENVDKNLPFRIELINDSIWALSGSLSPKSLGGTFHMTMLKWNGQVISIWGEK